MEVLFVFFLCGLILLLLFQKRLRRLNARLTTKTKILIWSVFAISIFSTIFLSRFIQKFFEDPNFDQREFFYILPSLILSIGIIASVLLAMVLFVYALMHTSAVAYANEVTKGLRQAKAKDEAMLESIGEGLVATGKDGNIILVNRAFERLLGWREEEAQGKLFTHLVPMLDETGKKVEYADRPIQKILKKGIESITATTAYYKTKNERLFPVAITISPIVVEGEIIGAVEVFRDISKEKEIDKEKTEFVSLASHQLRTPLSTINWYTEMLLSGDVGKLTENQKKYLNEIYVGSQRMVALVNSLLNVSRLEMGTMIIEPEEVDVVALAEDVVKEQKPSLEARKIFLEEHFGANIPKIMADPKLLRMVFQNLLSNAVKYTHPEGHIKISIELRPPSVGLVFTSKGEILIKVSDSGMGIPKEEQDRVFSKLFRASNVRAEDTEGTGLGLYIVKSVVEQSGGTVYFESEENKGTTFFVVLPTEGMKKKTGTKRLT